MLNTVLYAMHQILGVRSFCIIFRLLSAPVRFSGSSALLQDFQAANRSCKIFRQLSTPVRFSGFSAPLEDFQAAQNGQKRHNFPDSLNDRNSNSV
jgi:hypothetical protein